MWSVWGFPKPGVSEALHSAECHDGQGRLERRCFGEIVMLDRHIVGPALAIDREQRVQVISVKLDGHGAASYKLSKKLSPQSTAR
jgi:hypothetical protein